MVRLLIMKKTVLIFLLMTLSGNAYAIHPLTHYALCATAGLNLSYHISASQKKYQLDRQSEQIQKHLFLQSDEDPQQYANLVYQLKNVKSDIARLERNKMMSSLLLSCHLIYLGYHLRNRLLQSHQAGR